MSTGLRKSGVCLAAGAASAAATLGAGQSFASDPENFQGYEPGQPNTWVHNDVNTNVPVGSSLTPQPSGTMYGTQALQALSGANWGLLDPSTDSSTWNYGQYAKAGFNRLPPGDHPAGYSSFPGQTYHFQAFIYLSNQLGIASANNNNDIAWLPIHIMEDQGGGNFDDVVTTNYRVKRTNTSTFGLYEASSIGNIPLVTVPGDAWYGILETYSIDSTGFGRVDGAWVDASGNILNGGTAKFTKVFNGSGGPNLPAASYGGFGEFFPNFIDTSTNIDELGIPLDNVAIMFGSTAVIPPVPEPASLAALAAGGALLLGRRARR